MLNIPNKIFWASVEAFLHSEEAYQNYSLGKKLNTEKNGIGHFSDIFILNGTYYPECVKILSTKYTFKWNETDHSYVQEDPDWMRKCCTREILCLQYMQHVNDEREKKNELFCATKLRKVFEFFPDKKNDPDDVIYFIVMDRYQETAFHFFDDFKCEITEKLLRQFTKDTLTALKYLHKPFDVKEFIDTYGKNITIPDSVKKELGYFKGTPEERQRVIIHRDIKLQNSFVWRAPDNSPLFILGDFGSATFKHPTHPDGTAIVSSLEEKDMMPEIQRALSRWNCEYAYRTDSDIYLLGYMILSLAKPGSISMLSLKEGFSRILAYTAAENRYMNAAAMLEAIDALEAAEADESVSDTPIPENDAVHCRLHILHGDFPAAEQFALHGKDTSFACRLLYAFLQATKRTEESHRTAMSLVSGLKEEEPDNPAPKLLYYLICALGDQLKYTHAKMHRTEAAVCLKAAAEADLPLAQLLYAMFCYMNRNGNYSEVIGDWRSELVRHLDSAISAGFMPAVKYKIELLKNEVVYTDKEMDQNARAGFLELNAECVRKDGEDYLDILVSDYL